MESHLPTADEGRLTAVVLAAGLSRRMGARNKLLLPIAGTSLVRHCVTTVIGYPFAEVIVVTGHERARVEEELTGLAVRLVHNGKFEEGQMTSVRRGLEALVEPVAGVMVCLSDQPCLTTADLAVIARGFLERPGCLALVPTYCGARGNPVVLARASLADILARAGNFGCKQFVSMNADFVTTLPVDNDHVVIDVDRPEDFASLSEPAAHAAIEPP